MNATLLIAYQRPGSGRALPVAEVRDAKLLLEVARRAIADKRNEATGLSGCDTDLGMLAGVEADRLERALAIMIPGLRTAHIGQPVTGFRM